MNKKSPLFLGEYMRRTEFSITFNKYCEEHNLNLEQAEKNRLRVRSYLRWKKRHEQPDFDFEKDCIQGGKTQYSIIKPEGLKPSIETPENIPIHLTQKYNSLFQSFLGNLPEDTFDEDLKESFDYWKEHMDEKEAAKYATIEVLEKYKYIGPETSKYLQLKRQNLTLQSKQFTARLD